MPVTAQHRPPLVTAGPQRQASCGTMLGCLTEGQRSGRRACTCSLSGIGVDEAIRSGAFSGHPRSVALTKGTCHGPGDPEGTKRCGRVGYWSLASLSPKACIGAAGLSGRELPVSHFMSLRGVVRRCEPVAYKCGVAGATSSAGSLALGDHAVRPHRRFESDFGKCLRHRPGWGRFGAGDTGGGATRLSRLRVQPARFAWDHADLSAHGWSFSPVRARSVCLRIMWR